MNDIDHSWINNTIAGRVIDLTDLIKKNKICIKSYKIPNTINPDETTLISLAIGSIINKESCMQMIQFLLDEGVDVNENTSHTYKNIPLGKAILCDHIKVVAMLLAHPNIKVNKKNGDNKTPLDIAIDDEYENAILLLKQHDSKTNAQLTQAAEEK